MQNYSKIQKFLHNFVLSKKFINKSLFEIEKIIYLKNIQIKDQSHIFITGLPRSGTTSLLNFLFSSNEYASLTYNNMPFILSPNFSKLFHKKNIKKKERVHGDGITYDINSPEALDEVFFNNDDEFIKIVDGKVIESPILGCNGTMILDYLSIMFQNPTHLLPIPCLLSKEQSTGKTTLAQLIYNMFQGNSIILQTNDFLSNFNSHWVGKMFICVDEGHFEDKRRAKEQIKQVTTSDTVTLNTKGLHKRRFRATLN